MKLTYDNYNQVPLAASAILASMMITAIGYGCGQSPVPVPAQANDLDPATRIEGKVDLLLSRQERHHDIVLETMRLHSEGLEKMSDGLDKVNDAAHRWSQATIAMCRVVHRSRGLDDAPCTEGLEPVASWKRQSVGELAVAECRVLHAGNGLDPDRCVEDLARTAVWLPPAIK